MSLKSEQMEQSLEKLVGTSANSSQLDSSNSMDILDEFLDKRLYEDQNQQADAEPKVYPKDEEMFNNFLTDEINKSDFLMFDDIHNGPPPNQSFDFGVAYLNGAAMGTNNNLNVEATTPNSIDMNTSPKGEVFHTPNSVNILDSSYDNARNTLSQLKFGTQLPVQYNGEFPKQYLEIDEASLPYQLNVKNLPSYSRVETQIKLELSVSPPPPQFLIHLPRDTIAKQKFCLSEPLPEESKSNVLFLETFVMTASTLKSCNICTRCIRREQKRASRRKNGVTDNPNWSTDTNRRAIIFNCKEIISFPAEQSSNDSKDLDISARIVCYCRHHSESKGFKLLFILKNYQNEVLAKYLTTPIMIMDRKKNGDETSNSVTNSDTNIITLKSQPLSPTSIEDDSSEPHTTDSRVFKRKKNWSPELSDGFSIAPQRKPSTSINLLPGNASHNNSSTSLAACVTSGFTNGLVSQRPSDNRPIIQRIIPAQGPLRGGIEITLLGSNFKQGLNVKFGVNQALSTQCWSETTIVTYLPPAAQPGQVVVTIEDPELEPTTERRASSIFTYLDDTDRQMIELALQIVGLKMNGKLEDARNIARKIIGSSGEGDQSGQSNANGDNFGSIISNNTLNQLSAASDKNLVLKVIQLLPANPNLALCTTEGQTLLHLSCLKGYYKLVSLLLQKGARVDTTDSNGFTALHYAALKGDRKSIELLLNCKANLYAKSNIGLTPGDIADNNVLDIFKLNVSSYDHTIARKISSSSISSSIFSVEDVESTNVLHASSLTADTLSTPNESYSELDDDYSIEASDEESEYEYNNDYDLPTEQEEEQEQEQEQEQDEDEDLTASVEDIIAPVTPISLTDGSLWNKMKNVFIQEELPKYDDLFPTKFSGFTIGSSLSTTATTATTTDSQSSEVQDEDIFQRFFHQRKNFQNDKMLLFFWLPLLFIILSSFIMINYAGLELQFNDQVKEFIRKSVGNIMLGNERVKVVLNNHLSQVNEAMTSVIKVT